MSRLQERWLALLVWRGAPELCFSIVNRSLPPDFRRNANMVSRQGFTPNKSLQAGVHPIGTSCGVAVDSGFAVLFGSELTDGGRYAHMVVRNSFPPDETGLAQVRAARWSYRRGRNRNARVIVDATTRDEWIAADVVAARSWPLVVGCFYGLKGDRSRVRGSAANVVGLITLRFFMVAGYVQIKAKADQHHSDRRRGHAPDPVRLYLSGNLAQDADRQKSKAGEKQHVGERRIC